jgi:hypothetical protein
MLQPVGQAEANSCNMGAIDLNARSREDILGFTQYDSYDVFEAHDGKERPYQMIDIM